MILPSGSVLPSGLLEQGTDSVSGYSHTFQNYSIKTGIVIATYEIDDVKNLNKTAPEYDVAVTEQNGHMALNVITYQNCVAVTSFGGIADFMEYRLRPQKKVDKNKSDKDSTFQDGNLVLIMCLNGSSDKGIILGGLTHPKRKTNLTKDAGLSLYGEYNGLSWSVDKDGALKIFFNGATDNEGKAINEKVKGSYASIEKDGSLELNDGNKESIRIDKTKKTISLKSEKDMSLSTELNMNLSSKKDTDMKMDKLFISAQGGVTVNGSSFEITSKGNYKTTASDFSFNANGNFEVQAGQISLKGNQVIIGETVFLGGQGGTPAPTSTTLYMGIGNLGAPVLSMAISGFSSKVFIS